MLEEHTGDVSIDITHFCISLLGSFVKLKSAGI